MTCAITKPGLSLAGAACALALLVSGPAMAQGPATPSNPLPPTAAQPNAHGCAQAKLPAGPQTGGQPTPGTIGSADSTEHLSDKLARSDGVICPPEGIDPEIKAPTPDAGKMPVIPPPGSPGGDPAVRPK